MRNVFLTNRFFYALGGIVFIFAMGFAYSWLVPVGFGLLLALTIVVIHNGVILNKSLSSIKAQRELPKHFSMFDENEVFITIDNESSHNIDIRLIDEIPVQFQKRDFQIRFPLPANDEYKFTYDLKPLERGAYKFEKLHLFITSHARMIELRKSLDLEQIVKVYPSFIQMQMYDLMVFSADKTHPGIKKIRRIGHGYEFSDIRQYVPGDDPRTVNWKATSRSGQLMVNNYQDEKSQQIYAIINTSRVMRMPFEGLSLMDYAINATLSTLNIVLRNQDHAGLISFSKDVESFIPARSRNQQLQLIMDSLYDQWESQSEGNYPELYRTIQQKVKGRSLLLLFTNFMNLNALERALPHLKRLNRRHLLVVIFFENTELEAFKNEEVSTTLDIASKTMAEKLSHELVQATYELRNAGIQTIRTKPEDLSTNTINKYLELKSRGMI
ncbi:DUF58 domain-containing protein [Salibacter halophilus]|uniref:DUF58 domain-containing protein n=1 Tax=Salibacter halophilus TaxID=1803916 RepID=A0A6N6M664_9FLAO|nr:DUF58 domain-containing protein [Salibacter halophilus]KAB1065097.1 DUF58 domain-containing protein [Salibacter halophilus]